MSADHTTFDDSRTHTRGTRAYSRARKSGRGRRGRARRRPRRKGSVEAYHELMAGSLDASTALEQHRAEVSHDELRVHHDSTERLDARFKVDDSTVTERLDDRFKVDDSTVTERLDDARFNADHHFALWNLAMRVIVLLEAEAANTRSSVEQS